MGALMFLYDYLLEYNRYANLLGIFALLGIALLFSSNRKKINKMLVAKALGLQVVFGLLLLRIPFIEEQIVAPLSRGVQSIFTFACQGSSFLFGNLIQVNPESWGCAFAFKILPLIVFFAAFSAILSHYGIIQLVVSGFNKVIRPILGTTGAETLCASANFVLGQTEAPLLIRNYLPSMSRSEIFVVMTSGMAHVSGSIMAVYYSMGIPMKHMLCACVMAIPGAILMAKMLVPEETAPEQLNKAEAKIDVEKNKGNIFESIFQGTSAGVSLAINIGAMLLVFISLMPLIDSILAWSGNMINYPLSYTGFQLPTLSLSYFFSWVFAPFTFLLGLSGSESIAAAQVLGTKVTINEFVAFSSMLNAHFSERTLALLTYAVCGFSNFSSIGIQVGGIGALVPEKRAWLTQLGLRAVLASSMVNLMSAFIVGLLM